MTDEELWHSLLAPLLNGFSLADIGDDGNWLLQTLTGDWADVISLSKPIFDALAVIPTCCSGLDVQRIAISRATIVLFLGVEPLSSATLSH